MRAYEELLQYLEVTRPAGNGVIARCLAHEDRTPSMTVRPVEGKVLVHCFAGCSVDDILAAVGLDWNALYDEPLPERPAPKPELIETYVYRRPDGVEHMMVERWREVDGRKSFKQRTPDGRYQVRGLKMALYNLPAVTAHTGTVYLVEGERDVETAKRHGLVATTSPGGAQAPWQPYYWSWLQGASDVVIVADNDDVGRKHAAEAAKDLMGHGIAVRTVRAKSGKDLTDHLDFHCHSVDQLQQGAVTGSNPRRRAAPPCPDSGGFSYRHVGGAVPTRPTPGESAVKMRSGNRRG